MCCKKGNHFYRLSSTPVKVIMDTHVFVLELVSRILDYYFPNVVCAVIMLGGEKNIYILKTFLFSKSKAKKIAI